MSQFYAKPNKLVKIVLYFASPSSANSSIFFQTRILRKNSTKRMTLSSEADTSLKLNSLRVREKPRSDSVMPEMGCGSSVKRAGARTLEKADTCATYTWIFRLRSLSIRLTSSHDRHHWVQLETDYHNLCAEARFCFCAHAPSFIPNHFDINSM